jgi:hypothetical protein
MAMAPLSLLTLVAQAPMGRLETTTAEEIAVACALLGVMWLRFGCTGAARKSNSTKLAVSLFGVALSASN